MLKSNVAWSTNEDSYTQGKETAQKAVQDLIQTKVAFLYTSVDCNVEKVLEGAKAELGTAPIIGCTSSAGIIVPDGFISSEHGFTGILALGDPELEVGVAGSKKVKSARETGRKVAEQAMKNAGKEQKKALDVIIDGRKILKNASKNNSLDSKLAELLNAPKYSKAYRAVKDFLPKARVQTAIVFGIIGALAGVFGRIIFGDKSDV